MPQIAEVLIPSAQTPDAAGSGVTRSTSVVIFDPGRTALWQVLLHHLEYERRRHYCVSGLP
jgi:hypothetical protein